MKLVEKVHDIIYKGKPKTVYFNNERQYIPKKVVDKLKNILPPLNEVKKQFSGGEWVTPNAGGGLLTPNAGGGLLTPTTNASGGLLPLVTLLPLIFGGIGAAAGVGGAAAAIANSVSNTKTNEALVNELRGGSLYVNPNDGGDGYKDEYKDGGKLGSIKDKNVRKEGRSPKIGRSIIKDNLYTFVNNNTKHKDEKQHIFKMFKLISKYYDVSINGDKLTFSY